MRRILHRGLLCALSLCLFLAAVCHLSSCDPTYFQGTSEEKALVTVAIRSLPGCTAGHSSAYVRILETDEYGRTLFTYSESSLLDDRMLALCIMQKNESGTVYFLRGRNVVVSTYDTWPTTTDMMRDHFGEETIDSLKALNDWNQPTFAENMAHSKVRNDFSLEGEEKLNCTIFEEEFGHHSDSGICPMFVSDDGRMVVTVQKRINPEDGTYEVEGVYLIALTQTYQIDGESIRHMQKLTDAAHFNEEFALFLVNNGLAAEGEIDIPAPVEPERDTGVLLGANA